MVSDSARSKALIQILLIVLASWATANPGEERAASNSNILIVGDSISAAYQMEIERSWPVLLESALRESGLQVRVINISVSGETTGGALRRLPRALAAHDPDIVVIELGGNDGLRGYQLKEIRTNLLEMIELAQQSDARVIVAGMELPPNYGPEYTSAFRTIYREVSKKSNSALIPFLLDGIATDSTLMLDDGIHPNESAQPLIAEMVKTSLLALLRPADAADAELQHQPVSDTPGN